MSLIFSNVISSNFNIDYNTVYIICINSLEINNNIQNHDVINIGYDHIVSKEIVP